MRAVDLHEQIRTLKRALLVMHSPTDNTVGITNASKIFRAARHPRSFVSLEGRRPPPHRSQSGQPGSPHYQRLGQNPTFAIADLLEQQVDAFAAEPGGTATPVPSRCAIVRIETGTVFTGEKGLR